MTFSNSKIPSYDPCVAADPSNDYLAILVGTDCRFNSGATGIVTGKTFNISYEWPIAPWSGFTTVKIDDLDYVYGQENITKPPTDISPLENESICVINNIEVKQNLMLVTSLFTGRADTGMYKYTVTNNDAVPHNVGIRILIDTMLNDNDGAPFRVPGIVTPITTEMEFFQPNIPEYWQAFYSLDNPEIMAQGTLMSGGATAPDRFVLGYWVDINGTLWDYIIDPAKSVTIDSATALWWYPAIINPGETREFITFYGLGTMSGNAQLSITGPSYLIITDNHLDPNPFIITAYISNDTGIELTNVPVALSLSPGIVLDISDPETHIIDSIPSGSTMSTSWSVQAVQPGDWGYSVTALGQTVASSVFVPILDNIPPVTNCFITPEPNSDEWTNSDITVTLNAIDNIGGSDVKEVHYQIDGNPEVIVAGSTTTFTVASEGIMSLLYWAVDNSNNVETANVKELKIDKTAPAITINSPTAWPYLTNESLTVDYIISDETSGIKTSVALLDGMTVTTGAIIALTDKAGSHTLSISATDYAGNVTTQIINFQVLIATTIDIDPGTLNLKRNSNLNAITAYIEMPSDYDATNIDVSTVQLLINNVAIPAQLTPTSNGDYNHNNILDKMVKFSMQAVMEALKNVNGNVIFDVTGKLYNGLEFTGSDIVRVLH